MIEVTQYTQLFNHNESFKFKFYFIGQFKTPGRDHYSNVGDHKFVTSYLNAALLEL